MPPSRALRVTAGPWDPRPDELMLNAIARDVQTHVPHQPWSGRGNDPAPVELWFDARPGGPPVWRARFVVDTLAGTRLRWGHAEGPTVEAVLRAARDAQRGYSPPPGGSADGRSAS